MIRRKLFLVVLLGAIVPLALLALWLAQRVERAGLTLLQNDLHSSVTRLAQSVGSRWRYRRGDLLLLANNEVVVSALSGPNRPASPPQYLTALFASLDRGIRRITYVDMAGEVIWTLGADDPARTASPDRASAVATSVIALPLPIMSSDGSRRIGELRVELHVNALIPDTAVTGAKALAIFDARTRFPLTPTVIPARALTQNMFVVEGDEWLVARDSIADLPVILVLASASSPFVAPFREIARAGVVTLVVIAALVVLLTMFLTTRLTSGLVDLATAAERVRRGDMHTRVVVRSSDEVGQVAETFNAMTEQLQRTIVESARRESLAAVGQYAASLSHEVRNALTPIRFDLQRAAGQIDDEAERRRLLDRVLRNTERLDAIVSNSLRLSRTGSLERESFDLLEMLRPQEKIDVMESLIRQQRQRLRLYTKHLLPLEFS